MRRKPDPHSCPAPAASGSAGQVATGRSRENKPIFGKYRIQTVCEMIAVISSRPLCRPNEWRNKKVVKNTWTLNRWFPLSWREPKNRPKGPDRSNLHKKGEAPDLLLYLRPITAPL